MLIKELKKQMARTLMELSSTNCPMKEQGVQKLVGLLQVGRGLTTAHRLIKDAASRGIHGLIPEGRQLIRSKTENMRIRTIKKEVTTLEKEIANSINQTLFAAKDSNLKIKGIVEIIKGYVLHELQSQSTDLFKNDRRLEAADPTDTDKGGKKTDGEHTDVAQDHQLPRKKKR